MKVSWLIPVRNGTAWLGEAVASALAECSAGDEVIVVDDGSDDEPQRVLPADPRVLFRVQAPLGIVAALEHGRQVATGELLARLDADDVALPGRIGAQKAMFAAAPRLGAVGGQACWREAPGEGMRVYVDWVNGADPMRELLVESPLFHPAVTMRAAAVATVGGYRNGDFPEDYDLWLRLVASGWALASVAQPVVALRDRPGRLTRTDPRYRSEAFRGLKMGFLEGLLPERVVVWGGGRGGRAWRSWLGRRLVGVVDIAAGKGMSERSGIPVLPPERLPELAFDLLLVAVGARGAREEIRARIQAMRPELVEGRDWWAVA